jgi:hypothetical protein
LVTDVNPWNEWAKSFVEVPPIGYMLRGCAAERWFRVHALPEEKRTPQTDIEWRELLLRHNLVASAVLGCGAGTVAWLSHYGSEQQLPKGNWLKAPPSPRWALTSSVAQDLEEATFYFAEMHWVPGVLNDLLTLIARGQMGPVALHSCCTNSVFCPYEGGMDVFLPKGVPVPSVSSMFAEWHSKLPSGL